MSPISVKSLLNDDSRGYILCLLLFFIVVHIIFLFYCILLIHLSFQFVFWNLQSAFLHPLRLHWKNWYLSLPFAFGPLDWSILCCSSPSRYVDITRRLPTCFSTIFFIKDLPYPSLFFFCCTFLILLLLSFKLLFVKSTIKLFMLFTTTLKESDFFPLAFAYGPLHWCILCCNTPFCYVDRTRRHLTCFLTNFFSKD